MKIEFELPQLPLEKQIETVTISAMEKAIEKYYKKNATKEWMSIKEACEYIGISFNTFSKFRAMGLKVSEIDAIKRVSKQEIDNFLQSKSY